MGIIAAGVAPHPPIIIPEVGRGEEKKAVKTIKAMQIFAERLAKINGETIVFITPHGPMYRDALAILGETRLKGDFAGFYAPGVQLAAENDRELVRAIEKGSRETGIGVALLEGASESGSSGEFNLDHGVTVPLYFLQEAGTGKRCVAITYAPLSYRELYNFGKVIKKAAEELGRRVVVVASSDLSHRLSRDSQAGYHPRGKEFDRTLVKHLEDYQVDKILTMDMDLVQAAGECGLRSIAVMLGCLDGEEVKPEVLSYEGPFGVGYAVALFTPQGTGGSLHTHIARQALESSVKGQVRFQVPPDLPEEFHQPGAVFVSLKKHGALRGCIGTIYPSEKTLLEEIAINSLNAGLRDPRFPPVTEAELEELEYSVDVLTEPEKVESIAQLDPKVYGVIVRSGERSGVLLPALEGVDSVELQLDITRRKAGIGPHEDVEIFRFRVNRFY
ncbi:MAG TPA: AmmeMemoRadiSam system protein A [Firmicutes bacterium]|nr:AmmeMemoRadiSam system protein A [Bacillota bacterium]